MTSRGAIAESTPHILHIRPEALAKFSMGRLGRALTSVLGGEMTSSGAIAVLPPHTLNIRPEALTKFYTSTNAQQLVDCLG